MTKAKEKEVTDVELVVDKSLQPHKSQQVVLSQPDKLIEMAITQGADMAQLEKLLDLKERYDKEEARKAFTAALAKFKNEDVFIVKDKRVSFTNNDSTETSYTHASLGNIVKTAVPYLSKHGLSHRWDMNQGDGGVTVTCILTHEDGHSESTKLFSAPDTSGKKNPIQQIASAVTYLERYTFLAITGLAVEEQDDDGAAANVPAIELITDEQSNIMHSMITDNDIEMNIFMTWLRKVLASNNVHEIEDIPAAHYDKVINKIKATIKAKK